LTTFVCAALYEYTRTPLYTADTTLMIERKPPQFLRMQDARPENNNDYDYNNDFQKTQQEILKSRALAEPTSEPPGTIVSLSRDEIEVATGEGGLALLEVQPEGRRGMRVRDFLAGRPLSAGARLSGP
jgi:methionyl-tRNA formyltransferase